MTQRLKPVLPLLQQHCIWLIARQRHATHNPLQVLFTVGECRRKRQRYRQRSTCPEEGMPSLPESLHLAPVGMAPALTSKSSSGHRLSHPTCQGAAPVPLPATQVACQLTVYRHSKHANIYSYSYIIEEPGHGQFKNSMF